MRFPLRPLTVAGFLAIAALLFAIWVTDFVTVSGEWTIYTARCDPGQWHGGTCDGTMAAGDRHRFRALKAHREVLFWTVGETGESGRFTRCKVENGRNWDCAGDRQGPPAITSRMRRGIPVVAKDAPPLHRIPKWKWELLDAGLPAGHTAMD